MNYPLLLLYIATISLLIATPGPVVALVISDASRFGFRHAFRTVRAPIWPVPGFPGAAHSRYA